MGALVSQRRPLPVLARKSRSTSKTPRTAFTGSTAVTRNLRARHSRPSAGTLTVMVVVGPCSSDRGTGQTLATSKTEHKMTPATSTTTRCKNSAVTTSSFVSLGGDGSTQALAGASCFANPLISSYAPSDAKKWVDPDATADNTANAK